MFRIQTLIDGRWYQGLGRYTDPQQASAVVAEIVRGGFTVRIVDRRGYTVWSHNSQKASA